MTSSVQQKRRLQRLLKYYPPFLGAGIKVKRISEDLRTIEVHMPLRFWNRNYVGTHFGGSLYSMCDPFFMLILSSHLGRDYIVWDKAATIRFKKPGRGLVKATFSIPEDRISEIRAQADADDKTEPQFQVAVTDSDGNVVAEVDKLLYVRRKDRARTRSQSVRPTQAKTLIPQ